MITSDNGINFIKKNESKRLTAYPDASGYSIGYGHYGASPGQVITELQATDYLIQDLKIAEGKINSLGFSLNQNQFDALVDFVYNVGHISDNLKALLQAKNWPGVAAKFLEYDLNPGIIGRRIKEADLFLSGSSIEQKTIGITALLLIAGAAYFLLK